ncbi:MAG: Bug family tripartite tricarboxylate transporter substrate binding protein [Rhizobiaceae bacterium]
MGGFRTLLSCATAALVAAALTGPAASQQFPEHPITIVVPTSPGEPADALSRILAELMHEDLGQPIVVNNVVGGGGAKGQLAVKNAPADGYMVLNNWVSTHVVTPLFNPEVGYSIDDYEPLGGMLQLPFILVTSKDNPATDLPSFVEWAKAQGRPIRFGGCDALSLPRMLAEKFNEVAAVDGQGVPFPGCMPDNVKAVLDGSVDYAITVPNAVNVFGDQITALGTLSPERLAVLPDVATATEQGIDLKLGSAGQGWGGFAVKKGTPPEVVDRLTQVFQKWLTSAEFQERAVALKLTPKYSSPAEFGETWILARDGLAPMVAKLKAQ